MRYGIRHRQTTCPIVPSPWKKNCLVLLQRRGPGGLPVGRALVPLPPRPHRGGQVLEHRDGRVPVDARVRDADALLEAGGPLGGHLLVALVDVGLDHDADDGLLAVAQLVGDDLGHFGLVAVVLVGVAWLWGMVG